MGYNKEYVSLRVKIRRGKNPTPKELKYRIS